MSPEERLPLGPGPSPVHPRVREAMGRQVLGHLDPDFLDILDEVDEMLRHLFRTDGLTFAASSSGSGGMESSLVNLLEEGDTAIIATAGFFADRMIEMASRMSVEVVAVAAPWGRPVPPGEILDAMDRHPEAKLVAMVHAETSTGVWQPLEEVAARCLERETHLVVDAVASLGGLPLDVGDLGIDICYAGSQKCLSVPPGLAPITFSSKALATVEERKTPVRSWYFDVTGIRQYIGMDRKYHHTAPISMIFALREGLRMVLEEGLEARWKRHEEVGRRFQERLEGLGFELFAPAEHRLPQVTAALLPEGVDDRDARTRLLREHGIEIAGGLGEHAGRMWRIGLMGEGARHEIADRLLEAIEDVVS